MNESVNLVAHEELAVIDRWELERRARALASPVYLGNGVALCRVLGRYKAFVDASDVGFGANLLLDGFWETWLTVFIARRLRPGMHVADVGANHGYYSLLMADLVGPTGRVAAVEPNPHMCELVNRTVRLNGFADRVEVIQKAAGAEPERLRLVIPVGEPKNAYVAHNGEAANEVGETVSVTPLAECLAHWPRLDFVKMDVEGGEQAAIAGLLPLLVRDRPQLVLEYHPLRSREPAQLIDSLRRIYGNIHAIGFDAELQPVDDPDLLDVDRRDDWMLYFN